MSEVPKSIHTPVMGEEVKEWLKAEQGGSFLDCTLGGGGHTRIILEAHPSNMVLAIDRDGEAIARAREQLRSFGSRLEVLHVEFSEVVKITAGRRFHGVLADLGTSMDQLKGGRGFSFFDDAPLDMRMNQENALSAAVVVNEYSERELLRVLRAGGLGKEASRVARAIMRGRPFSGTKQLAEIIELNIPHALRKEGIHPATLSFQAIRMEVNDELHQLEQLLEQIPSLVKEQGRAAVISFHSGEDKIVTRAMRAWAKGDDSPALWREKRRQDRPEKQGNLLTRSALTAGTEEIQRNPSARSARMRVFEFIMEAGEH